MEIRIAGTVDDSIVDGPGIRYTVFVQGCSHHCPGCHNPHTHDFAGGRVVNTEEIVAQMRENPLLDGLTLSGGEPFEQPDACAELARQAHALGLNVWCYTGYKYEQLLAGDASRQALLSELDVLVDGPFLLAERSLDLLYRGSRNQRLIDVHTGRESGNSGGGGFSIRSPSPGPPPEDWGLGRLWGRGRFSERSASPPDPLSRRAAGVRRSTLLLAWFRLSVGAVPCELVESTAADRAAADVRGEGWGDSGGEAASLREAPLPQPLSRRAVGVRRGTLLLDWFRLSVGVVPSELVVSTAADRAAADLRVQGGETLGERPLL